MKESEFEEIRPKYRERLTDKQIGVLKNFTKEEIERIAFEIINIIKYEEYADLPKKVCVHVRNDAVRKSSLWYRGREGEEFKVFEKRTHSYRDIYKDEPAYYVLDPQFKGGRRNTTDLEDIEASLRPIFLNDCDETA